MENPTPTPFAVFYSFLSDRYHTNLAGVAEYIDIEWRTLKRWCVRYSRTFKKTPADIFKKIIVNEVRKTYNMYDTDDPPAAKIKKHTNEFISSFLSFITQGGFKIPLIFQKGYSSDKKEAFDKFFELFLYDEDYSILDTVEIQKVFAASYYDLSQRGYTAKRIAKRLVSNDKRLFGTTAITSGTIQTTSFSEANAGTREQWAEYLSSWPDSFEYLINFADEIVGNYSFVSLYDQQYIDFCNGTIAEKDLKPIATRSIYQPDTSHIMLLLNLSVNSEYNTVNNSNMIRAMFWNKVAKLAREGVIFKKIVVNVFRPDHKEYFESLGFREKCDHKQGGTIYEIDMIPYPHKLNEELSKNVVCSNANATLNEVYDLSCEQLQDDSALTNLQRMDLSKLIYKTDRYIYPCLFQDETVAAQILPPLIESKDSMFRKSNYFVAKLNGRIIGMILWHKGKLNWNNNALINLIRNSGLSIPNGFEKVCTEYFETYNQTDDDVLSVINVCMADQFQNIGLGTLVMKLFCNEHTDEKMELFVLAENKAAIHIYEKCGFKTIRKESGFSPDDFKPDCCKMTNYDA